MNDNNTTATFDINAIRQAAQLAGISKDKIAALINHLSVHKEKPIRFSEYVQLLLDNGAPDDFMTNRSRQNQYVVPRYIMWYVGVYVLSMPVGMVANAFSQSHCMSSHVLNGALPGMCIDPDKYFRPYLGIAFVQEMILRLGGTRRTTKKPHRVSDGVLMW